LLLAVWLRRAILDPVAPKHLLFSLFNRHRRDTCVRVGLALQLALPDFAHLGHLGLRLSEFEVDSFAFARLNSEAWRGLQARLRWHALLLTHRHGLARRVGFRSTIFHHVVEKPHQAKRDGSQDEQPDDKLGDCAHINIARLMAHVRVLYVRHVRRLVYVVLTSLSHSHPFDFGIRIAE
jgi:hypothetical protein